MSWAKSRTIIRLLSLSKSRRLPTIRDNNGFRRRESLLVRRNHDSEESFGSSLRSNLSPSNCNSGQRFFSSSAALFSTAPSTEFLDHDRNYDGDGDERENDSPRKRVKRVRGESKPKPNDKDRNRNTDYEQSTIDRIVSSGIGEYQSLDVDSVVTEGYLQRLVDDHISNQSQVPPNPNMLLNMLELLHNEETHISTDTVLKIFREVVRSKRVKLLERAEEVVVKNRYDPRLLRLLVTGYLNAGVPRKACQLLMEWPNESILHQPGIESYRRVLTALGQTNDLRNMRTKESPSRNKSKRKEGNPRREWNETVNYKNNDSSNTIDNQNEPNYILARQLLQHMCQTHAKFPELSLSPDRNCFHQVLAACSSIESMPTAIGILEDMRRFSNGEIPESERGTTDVEDIKLTAAIDTQPTLSTIRLLVKAWGTKHNKSDTTIDTQKEAFNFLRLTEEGALTSNSPPIVDIDCYNVILNNLAELGRYEVAENLFLRLLTDYLKGEKSNIQPDTVTLNTVLKSHLQANTEAAAVSAEAFLERLDQFFEQQKRMRQKKQGCPDTPRLVYDIQPTARARSTVSNLWIKLGQPQKAIEVLSKAESVYQQKEEEIQARKEHYPDNDQTYNMGSIKRFKPDKICYRQIIGALSKLQDPPSVGSATTAEEIAERMCHMGHRLNLLTCNTILNCWTKSGHPDRAEIFLEETMLQKHQVIPDIVSYNTIIHGYARLGNLERALELLTRLLEVSLTGEQQPRRYPKPNVRTFTSILIALSKEHSINAAEEAERLLLQMQELNDAPYNLNTRPNTVTYNAVMNCWASLSFPSSIRERRQKQQHKHQTAKGNAKIKRKANGIAVDQNENGHHRFGRKAEFVLRSMQGLGPDERPNTVSYNIVMRAYSNDMVKAEELVRDMIDNGLEPTEHTFKTLIHVLNRDFRIRDKDRKLKELRELYFSSSPFAVMDSRLPSRRDLKATLKQ
eukprot:jgi/Psemu1/326771/estExt_fgenesh1_pg.C_4660016